MINVGVIGIGYWGPNIVRNFYKNPNTTVRFCCDLKKERLNFIKNNYPTINTTTDCQRIVKNPELDLIAICTPVFTHYKLAKAALQAGKHVLIEKPMTSTAQESEELLNIGEQKGLKVFVDHTFLFTGAVRKMKEVITRGEIGKLYYFDSVRINLGLFQHDVNVVWDLAPHDISIMHYLLEKKPEAVFTTGASHFNDREDVAYLTVYYPDKLISHIHVNWLSPVKVRQTIIAGDKKMILWDDNHPIEKVRIYDRGVEVINSTDDVYKMLIQYRTGDMYCPKLDSTEGLTAEVNNIVDSILHNIPSIADGQSGLMVVKILEAAQKSLKNRGKEVKI